MSVKTTEERFKETLNIIAGCGMTAEEIKNDGRLYNEIAEEAVEFFGKVALLSSRNRSVIKSTGEDFDAFLDGVVMHFLDKLDAVMECSEEGRIPFVIAMTNRKVVDIARSFSRFYGTAKTQAEADSEKEDEREMLIALLDEAAWEHVADDNDIELACENNALLYDVLTALDRETKAFDAAAFMAIQLLDWKPSVYGAMLIENGYRKTLEKVLSKVMYIFDATPKTFSNIINDCRGSEYEICTDLNKLSAELSRSCYSVKKALRKNR